MNRRVKLYKIMDGIERQVAEGYPMGPEVGRGLWILDCESLEPRYFRTSKVKGFVKSGLTTNIQTVNHKYVMRQFRD